MRSFWPNAADLALKAMAYNLILVLKQMCPDDYRRLTAERFRRKLLRISGRLVSYTRQVWLRPRNSGCFCQAPLDAVTRGTPPAPIPHRRSSSTCYTVTWDSNHCLGSKRLVWIFEIGV